MSQIMTVLKNRNKVERRERQRRQEELQNIKVEATFRSKLYENSKLIDIILSDDSVESVIIKVPKEYITKFMRAMYGEEMAQYSIEQLDEQRFEFKRKLINF